MSLAAGFALALASTIALNWGWVEQHHAASALQPLSLRHPLQALAALFRDRGWVVGFVTGLGGWALYVAALALAPLSLVQAMSAGGVAAIAFFARARGAELSRSDLTAVGLAVAGLVLLAVSLGHHASATHRPGTAALAAWLAGSAALAALASTSLTAGAGLGAAAGILYAAGDVATKGAVAGVVWFVLVPLILAAHGLAFVALQLAFQRGTALASAGLSTLLTNALPIAAGVALFAERVPGGVLGAVRVASFALVVAAAALLAVSREPAADALVPAGTR